MKRNYQSEAQKRQAKRRKIAVAARNSQQLSSWLTQLETSKADEQDVSICETESTPQLVDISIHKTENSDTTTDRSVASKNDNFPTIVVNSEIKKAIIAAGPKQPQGPYSLKICSKAIVHFQQLPFCNTIRSKTTKILVMLFIQLESKERFCDVMKCLTQQILTSTKPKERDEAMAIKNQIKNLDFVIYAGCAMQYFAGCQHSFKSYAV